MLLLFPAIKDLRHSNSFGWLMGNKPRIQFSNSIQFKFKIQFNFRECFEREHRECHPDGNYWSDRSNKYFEVVFRYIISTHLLERNKLCDRGEGKGLFIIGAQRKVSGDVRPWQNRQVDPRLGEEGLRFSCYLLSLLRRGPQVLYN